MYDYFKQTTEISRDIYNLFKSLVINGPYLVDDTKAWFEPRSSRQFRDVYAAQLADYMQTCVGAYINGHRDLEAQIKQYEAIDVSAAVAERFAIHVDEFWHVKNNARVIAKQTLETLPIGSLERAYIWSILNFFYGYHSNDLTVEKLQKMADDIAQSPNDTVLDTPNTSLARLLRDGEIRNRDAVLKVIAEESDKILKRYKISHEIYWMIDVKHNLRSKRD